MNKRSKNEIIAEKEFTEKRDTLNNISVHNRRGWWWGCGWKRCRVGRRRRSNNGQFWHAQWVCTAARFKSLHSKLNLNIGYNSIYSYHHSWNLVKQISGAWICTNNGGDWSKEYINILRERFFYHRSIKGYWDCAIFCGIRELQYVYMYYKQSCILSLPLFAQAKCSLSEVWDSIVGSLSEIVNVIIDNKQLT